MSNKYFIFFTALILLTFSFRKTRALELDFFAGNFFSARENKNGSILTNRDALKDSNKYFSEALFIRDYSNKWKYSALLKNSPDYYNGSLALNSERNSSVRFTSAYNSIGNKGFLMAFGNGKNSFPVKFFRFNNSDLFASSNSFRESMENANPFYTYSEYSSLKGYGLGSYWVNPGNGSIPAFYLLPLSQRGVKKYFRIQNGVAAIPKSFFEKNTGNLLLKQENDFYLKPKLTKDSYISLPFFSLNSSERNYIFHLESIFFQNTPSVYVLRANMLYLAEIYSHSILLRNEFRKSSENFKIILQNNDSCQIQDYYLNSISYNNRKFFFQSSFYKYQAINNLQKTNKTVRNTKFKSGRLIKNFTFSAFFRFRNNTLYENQTDSNKILLKKRNIFSNYNLWEFGPEIKFSLKNIKNINKEKFRFWKYHKKTKEKSKFSLNISYHSIFDKENSFYQRHKFQKSGALTKIVFKSSFLHWGFSYSILILKGTMKYAYPIIPETLQTNKNYSTNNISEVSFLFPGDRAHQLKIHYKSNSNLSFMIKTGLLSGKRKKEAKLIKILLFQVKKIFDLAH